VEGENADNPQDGALIDELAAEQYPTISQWLETNPTRAIQQFDEGSVDLLVLNVTPQDDSVDYLLDRWLSRLSAQGVVLLPGIARREPGCQVFRAFEALQAQYPHFSFHHGNGLGVIAVGQQPTTLLHNLLASLESTASSRVVQDIFARLGRSCRDKLTAQEHRALVRELEERVSGQAEHLQNAEQQRAMLNEQLVTSQHDAVKLKKRLESQEERFAHERDRLAERVSSLEEFNQELKQELMRQRNQSEQRESERREQLNTANSQLSEKEQALANAHTDLAHAKHESTTRFEELAKLTTLLESKEQALQQATKDIEQTREAANTKVQAAQVELVQAQQESTTRFEELAKLTTLLETSEQTFSTEREETARLAKQVEQLTADLKRPSNEAEALKRQLAQQRQEAKVFADERFRELAILTELLEEANAPITAQPLVNPVVKKAPPLTKRSTKRQIALIEASRFFNPNWYLGQYPDIARDPKMSANPARHYLLMGGFEGRNPGPEFDSAFYLATHQDVVESGINPLVHYIKFGEREQRAIKA
jgi:hypothetical protein